MTLPQPLAHYQTASIAIWGLSREGLSTYQFLRQQLPQHHLFLLDDKEPTQLSSAFQKILSSDPLVSFATTTTTQNLPTFDLVFMTPGIPLAHPYRAVLAAQKTTLTSNTQLFLELAKPYFPQLTTIGVTGTKGKSTTSALIFAVLQKAIKKVWLGGNIGTPALELWPKLAASLAQSSEAHFVVLELSCHQLHALTLSPHLAVIQNIVPEHLDYYGTFETYVAAKAHITQHQTAQDFVIFNPQYPVPQQLANKSAAQPLPFSVAQLPPSLRDSRLQGAHNWENMMPALVIGKHFGILEDTIIEALKDFSPLPHRLELVATVNGVEYYNDSLATVPEATLAALTTFGSKKIVLIAGGFDRGLDYSPFAQEISAMSLRGLLLFPTTGEKIAQVVRQNPSVSFPIQHVQTMAEAVTSAASMAQSGEVVVMSPAAASFNAFKDYEDRGEQFRAAVMSLL